MMNTILAATAVVYFSYSGNTKFAAETIAHKLGADIYEIKAVKAYPEDYTDCCDEAKPECYGKALRAIQPLEVDFSKYDTIVVGTPNWWGTMAPPVRTWVTQNAALLKTKKTGIFNTHGGGGLQRVGKEFAELVPGAKVLPPRAFSGSRIKSSVSTLEQYAEDCK